MRPETARAVRRAILPVLLLIWWELSADLGTAPEYVVAPSAVAVSLWLMLSTGELFHHAAVSLGRLLAGFVIGSVFGAAAGLASAVLRPVGRFYDPLISLTYPVPKVAVLPLVFAWFGIGSAADIVIITLGVFYPVYLSSYYGGKEVRRVVVWAARAMGASRWQVFMRVVVPSAAPQVLAGLRVGLALSFILMVTSELVSAEAGLGYLIGAAQQNFRFDIMYVALTVIGVLGFLGDRAMLWARGHLLAGQMLGKGAHA